MIPRLFTPLELSQGAVVPLDGAASHHAIRVLRLGPGAAVELFDGRGQCRRRDHRLDVAGHGAGRDNCIRRPRRRPCT